MEDDGKTVWARLTRPIQGTAFKDELSKKFEAAKGLVLP